MLTKLFKVYVRPILESSSQVFNNNIKCNVKTLETVQKFATRIIFLRCFSKKYDILPSYSERLKVLNLQTLENRRLLHDLLMFHKIKFNLVKINNRNISSSRSEERRVV